MKKITALIAIAVLVLAGCASTPLAPHAAQVFVTTNPAPKGCRYMGQVVGNQGNYFTGAWTSNKNLEAGAMNDLRNQASRMGANYVHLITNRAGITGGSDSSSSQTNVTNLGNAYFCPRSSVNW